jgi:hypothetical protein
MNFLYIPREALAAMPPEKAEALGYGGSGSPVTGPNQAISPFSLERKGAILTGRLKDIHIGGTSSDDGGTPCRLEFNEDRCQSLQAAKEGHSKIVGMIKDFANKLEKDPGERFPPEVPE